MNDMAVAITFYDTGPTYFSSNGKSASNIDHILIPVQATNWVSKIYINSRLTKKLQLVAV